MSKISHIFPMQFFTVAPEMLILEASLIGFPNIVQRVNLDCTHRGLEQATSAAARTSCSGCMLEAGEQAPSDVISQGPLITPRDDSGDALHTSPGGA